MNELGKRIKAERKKQHWTQRELGIRTGYGASYISQIEKGTTIPSNPKALDKFAMALNLELKQLLGLSFLSKTGNPIVDMKIGIKSPYKTTKKAIIITCKNEGDRHTQKVFMPEMTVDNIVDFLNGKQYSNMFINIIDVEGNNQ